MAKYYTGVTPGTTLDSMIANGGDYGVTPSLNIDCEDIACKNVVGVAATFSAEVKCTSTTAPFYPPVVTSGERDAMTVTAGAMVFNSSTNKLNVYSGSAWEIVESA
jgi:hypothetical protein